MWCLEKQAAADAENELSSEVIRTTIYNEPESEYYCEPQFPTRELPPLPVANHTNGPTDNITNNEPQIDSEISSDFAPSLVVEGPYSGLESSTREPPSSPASYDNLVKPVYYNTNEISSEVTNDIICDEERNDSGISIQKPISITSSEDETTI